MQIRHRWIATFLALFLLLPTAAATASPAAASNLPGGRSTYVVSLIGGKVNAMAVKLATYVFSPQGTVTETYWVWRQDSISGKGNAVWTKPSSGYRTAGCRYNCPIRTPYGFQTGRAGRTFTGTWSVTDATVTIHWSATAVERWALDTSQPRVVVARLIGADANNRGWGLGSNAAASTAVNIAGIFASGRLYGPLAQNAYGRANDNLHTGWRSPDYQLCTNHLCMQGKYVTDPDKRKWYSSYLAANPAVDGRKVFLNSQTGVVQQMENPGSTRISSSGGGHTDAGLEALDDTGRLVGLVGVEASLNQRKTSQAVVGAFAMGVSNLQPILG